MDKEKSHADYLLSMAEELQKVWNDYGDTINGLETALAYAAVLRELRYCEYWTTSEDKLEHLSHPADRMEATREKKKTPKPRPPKETVGP